MNNGERWIKEYLMRFLSNELKNKGLNCLLIDPGDEEEKEALLSMGHNALQIENVSELSNFEDNSFDLILYGKFTRDIQSSERTQYASLFHSKMKPKGSLILTLGNAKCPIDFSKNSTFLHSLSNDKTLSKEQIEGLFHEFSIQYLPIDGHFSWSSVSLPFKIIGNIFNLYWKYLIRPENRLYHSFMNPQYNLLLRK